MKTSPTNSSMTIYHVTIAGQEFDTTASNPQAAISKCAYKYGFRMNVPVALVQYKIRKGELKTTVKEG